jgi:serine/threonine protein phosphatase 1
MQTLVVGDIHGCYDEFLSLLDAAGLAVDDLIISAGDFVDRGPKTPEVLSFFMENAQARAVMGNHERKHVRASRHEVQLARSQRISKIQFGDSYSAALAFMDTLPLYLDLPDALVVHGYFEPGIPVDKQHPTVLCGTRSGEGYLKKKYDQLWFELYDGEKPLVVGHENYSKTGQPFVYKDRVFGLDTDCFTGATLTGLLLPSFRFVSVPSRANHWMLVRRMYPETENRTQPRSGKRSSRDSLRGTKKMKKALRFCLPGCSKPARKFYWNCNPNPNTRNFARVNRRVCSIRK